jgi:DNA polymerase I-like protein with 3'-5' exonuclease and polymerase domains
MDPTAPDCKHNINTAIRTMLVGHNIAFDLDWAARCYGIESDCLDIWDTQIAEYILTGQESKMSSLNELALKYGGTVKDEAVSEYFKKGLGADYVPPALLKDYLDSDLKNTELVFKAQWLLAQQQGQLPLILLMMKARLATWGAAYRGMYVDVDSLLDFKNICEIALMAAQASITGAVLSEVTPHLPKDAHLVSDVTTDGSLSCYLFGGTATYDIKTIDGVYKSGAKKGQPKYKNGTMQVTFTKKAHPPNPSGIKRSARYSLIHPMDDAVLNTVARITIGPARAVAERLLSKRRHTKLVSTYCDSILRNTDSDGYVHPTYNHAVTATGRLSCSEPNLQNQDEVLKEFFCVPSSAQVLVEFDFKQLEVCALAHLTEDAQLIADVTNGVDLHYETGKTVFGWRSPSDMDDKTRRGVKGVNFGLIYGGSAGGLALTTGFDKSTVERLIAAFYARYPGVKAWQERNMETVKRLRVYRGDERTPLGYPSGKSLLKTETGRMYCFSEYDAPDWLKKKGVHTSFSPTQVKNYPVQGFGTADIVPITLAVLYDYQCNGVLGSAKLINTVHDSFLFLCHKSEVNNLVDVVTGPVIEQVVRVLKDVLGVELKVPLRMDYKVGVNWKDMKKPT